ncbi:MAG: branched-chain amino acid ABC transporter permease [Acidimicrobiales bacterium]
MKQNHALLVMDEGSAAHKIYRLVFGLLIAGFAIWLPHFNEDFRVGQFTKAMAFMVAVIGLNLIIGYSGLLSLGTSAFMGMGAYIGAILVQDFNWDYWQTLPIAILACFVAGVILGIPSLRIKGLYLAVVTLSLAVTFPTILKMEVKVPGFYGGELTVGEFTGGANGKKVREKIIAPEWLGWMPGIDNQEFYVYYINLAFLAGSIWVARNLIKSRPGRAIIAIRDNETGAAVSGVNLPLYKTMTFGVSAGFAAVAGIMYLMEVKFVSADTDFNLGLAILLLAGLVVGGVGTLESAIPAGLLMVFVPWRTSNIRVVESLPGKGPVAALGPLFFGLLLIVLTFVMPGGIVAGIKRVWNYLFVVRPVPPKITAGEALTASPTAGVPTVAAEV